MNPRRRHLVEIALLGVLSYLPALLTAPGTVAADTKHYLLLDPSRLLRRAGELWDTSQFGGHVSHQVVGYLWPMGPWFALGDLAGLPDWVTQRLWVGTVLFAAGTGVRFLARHLGLPAVAALVAAVAYLSSPFVLTYVNRTSVLLTPWAGLGWIVAATVLAARRGGWRWPAVVALVSATVGGINATAVALVAVAPVTWLVHAAWRGEITWRRAGAVVGRIAAFAVPANAWWAVPLLVQSRYGADVLAYSETVDAVATTSSAPEVLRGLGYWLFYGGDFLGRWNSASTPYLTDPALLGLGFGLVVAVVVAIVAVRWSASGWLATLLVTGTVIAVGAHPPGDPSPWGSLLLGDASRSTLVLALRSSTRAVPLVALAGALALGAAVAALAVRWPRRGALAAAALTLAVLVNGQAAWTGGFVDATLQRPEQVPAWWPQAAAALGESDTAVLELPGQDFAAYRWGTTTDPVLPGLTDRPVLGRDLLPLGSPGRMDLLWALDDTIQDGTFEPAALEPVARLLGVGDVVIRGDAAWERYRTLPPAVLAEALADRPARDIGEARVDPSGFVDERILSTPARAVPPVRIVAVDDPVPVARVRTAVIGVDGDGAGIVSAAAAGLLPPERGVVQATTVPDDATLAAMVSGAPLVVTDGARVRARQWRGSQDTIGMTEDGDGPAVLQVDPADARLPVLANAPSGSRTIAVQTGGGRATATSYGSPNAYWPEARPVGAVDGDPATAWFTGEGRDVRGVRFRITFDAPRQLPRISVRQLDATYPNRMITAVRIRTDGSSRTVELDERSRQDGGQVVNLDAPSTATVELEVLATEPGPGAGTGGLGPVGFVEIDAGIRLTEEVRVPTRLASMAEAGQPLTFVLRRERVDGRVRWRDDPEPAIVRRLRLPQSRRFELTGVARLSPRADDARTDAVVGDGTVTTTSRLTGVPAAGGRAAFDADPGTAWITRFGAPVGASVSVDAGREMRIDRLTIGVVDDARHSVPTVLDVTVDDTTRQVAVPASAAGGAATIVIDPPLVGRRARVTIAAAAERTGMDPWSGPVVLPAAVHTLRLGDLAIDPARTAFETGCRDDLVTIDGRPLPVRLRGPFDGAVVEACDTVELAAGEHVVRTAPGRRTGIDLDRLVLRSAPTTTAVPTGLAGRNRTVEVDRRSASQARITIAAGPAAGPAWFVWGEGWNRGWQARIGGRDLGAPQDLDGGANAWRVDLPSGEPVTIDLRWAPQDWVTRAHWLSLATAAVALGVVVFARRRGPLAPPVVVLRRRECTVPLPWGATAAVTAGAAVVGAVFVGPVYGPLLALATLLGARRPARLPIPARTAVLGMAVVALAVVARQVVADPAASFGWPRAFAPLHRPALAAILLVGADTILGGAAEFTRRRVAARERSRTAPASSGRSPA